jgi:hypothetical protein
MEFTQEELDENLHCTDHKTGVQKHLFAELTYQSPGRELAKKTHEGRRKK